MVILEYPGHKNYEQASKLLGHAHIAFDTEIEPGPSGTSWIYFYENMVSSSAHKKALDSALKLECHPIPFPTAHKAIALAM